jgi:hypothetical protein
MINVFGVSVLGILYIQFNNMSLVMQETEAFIAYNMDRWDKGKHYVLLWLQDITFYPS